MRPARWTAHHPTKCGAGKMPEGYPCRCPPFWPRRAAWWNGTLAIGAKAVDDLMAEYQQHEQERTP